MWLGGLQVLDPRVLTTEPEQNGSGRLSEILSCFSKTVDRKTTSHPAEAGAEQSPCTSSYTWSQSRPPDLRPGNQRTRLRLELEHWSPFRHQGSAVQEDAVLTQRASPRVLQLKLLPPAHPLTCSRSPLKSLNPVQ